MVYPKAIHSFPILSLVMSFIPLSAYAGQEAERRFAFLLEPSSQGTAGETLDTEPALVSVSKFGLPDLRPLTDLQVAAFQDASCTIPAPGVLSVRDFGLLTYVGIALYTRLSDTAAGKTYFKFSAKGVKSVCSKRVTIRPGAADHLAQAGGDGQSGDPGALLPIQARAQVLDKFGNAVSGTRIAFSVSSGGGSVNPAEATSDTNGIAASSLRLGPSAGTNTYLATRSGSPLPGNPGTLTFVETARGTLPANLPTRLGLSGPSSPGAGACSVLTVVLLGNNDQPVSAASATPILLSGLGSGVLYSDISCATPLTALSIAGGSSQVSVYWKDTRAEALALRASSPGLQSSALLAVEVKPGAAVALGFALQPSLSAVAGTALALQPSLRVLDAFGNGVSAGSYPVTIAAARDERCEDTTQESGLIAANNPVATSSGTAVFEEVRLAKAGVHYLVATSDGLSPVCSHAIEIQPAAPSELSVIAGGSQMGTVGVQLPLTLEIRVSDALGNVVSGAGLALAVIQGGGSVSAEAALSDAAGLAQIAVTLGNAPGTQLLSIRATLAGRIR
jgi:hypothetical protein